MLSIAAVTFAVILACLLLAAGGLHLLGKIGLRGLGAWFCRAPGLDVWIFYFTIAPCIAGPVAVARAAGPDVSGAAAVALGLLAAVLAQIAAVLLWGWAHEFAHRKSAHGPRLVGQLNRSVGKFRNHAAVWWTAWAVPLFAIVRLAQYFVYPRSPGSSACPSTTPPSG